MKEFFNKYLEKWNTLAKPYKILIILILFTLLSRAIVVFGG